MQEKNAPHVAVVSLWGKPLGAVSDAHGLSFQYDPSWVKSSVEVSPLRMPLRGDAVHRFPHLAKIEAFQGLPGLLADALPDQFGNKLAAAYYASKNKSIASLSPVERLLYMGKRAMGALEFEPAVLGPQSLKNAEIIEVKKLVEQSRRLIEGHMNAAIPDTLAELIRVGGSAGGARPKAVVLWDKDTHVMRSGFAAPRKGEEAWLIKFDGTGSLEHPDAKPQPFNRIEYVYSLLARQAGIQMSDTAIFEDGDFAHFMTKRFDRDGKQKHHIHSLAGMLHVDFNDPQAIDYLDYLDTCRKLGMGQPSLAEAYRRVVFNIIGVNQDDHVKNFAFRLKEGGQWELAPAYDLSFVKGQGWTKEHQIRLLGSTSSEDFTYEKLILLGKQFDLPAREIVQEVADAFQQWPALAKLNNVPERYIQTIQGQHRFHLSSPVAAKSVRSPKFN